MSETHCAVCGRLLTDPDSVRRGIGPVCWKNIMELDEEEMQKLETVEDLTKYICPICGQIIAKPGTASHTFKGMLAMHIKGTHSLDWEGSLKKTLNTLRKKVYEEITQDYYYMAKDRDAREIASFWRLVQPMYIQLKREEPSPKRDLALDRLESAREAFTSKKVYDYYQYMKEWFKH